MILSKLSEDERRELARVFTFPGWALLKKEYQLRKDQLIHDIVYSVDRAKDADRRALVVAIDTMVGIEKEFFAPPPPPEQPFVVPTPTGNRYDV